MPTSVRFTTGDRVIGIEQYDDNDHIIGVTGTVIADDADGRYSVEFDENIHGHNLEYRCSDGHGWHVSGRCIALFDEAKHQLAPSMNYDEVMM